MQKYKICWGLYLLLSFLIVSCASNNIITENDKAKDSTYPLSNKPQIINKNERQIIDERGKPISRLTKIAVLLPLNAPSKNASKIANDMLDAIETALFELNNSNIKLLIFDTKGNLNIAKEQALEAVNQGVNLFLGPLYSSSINIVGDIALENNIKMIAFSSDRRNLGQGRYLFSFPDELEIARIMDYAIVHDISRFGLLVPNGRLGDRLLDVIGEDLYIRGAQLIATQRYDDNANDIGRAVRKLALRVKVKAKPFSQDKDNYQANVSESFENNALNNKKNKQKEGFDYSIQAIIMPDEGSRIEKIVPYLPFNDLYPEKIKFIGLSGWQEKHLINNPLLQGGWFAAADPNLIKEFSYKFKDIHKKNPHKNAILAYDAMLIVGNILKNNSYEKFSHNSFIDPIGFFGASGLFRLTNEGWIERGLAVIEIKNGRAVVIDPAPISFESGYNN